MNTTPGSSTRRAITNLSTAIDAARRFPANVFIGQWSDFVLFDADWVFDTAFVELTQILLKSERAACACLVDLDAAAEGGAEGLFVLGRATTKKTTGLFWQERSRGAAGFIT